MKSPLQSLIASGTRLWLDTIDPDEVIRNRALGASGATSNPLIVSELIQSGRFDGQLGAILRETADDEQAAWRITDELVRDAQSVFLPVHRSSQGDDGYVSFELDPLLEDPACTLPPSARTERYVELGRHWSAGQENRLIKVPATEAGLAALEPLAAAGVPLNVTLIFTMSQYRQARDAVWRGARRLRDLSRFKSVYSIFVSRVDVYTEKHVPSLSPAAQGLVGIVGAKRIWAENREFWSGQRTPLSQEIVFASTGTKKPEDPPWKYVEAFAGSDIETNPPATNAATEQSGRTFHRRIDELPPASVLQEIDAKVDVERLERTLLDEGVRKFAQPHQALIDRIARKRAELMSASGSGSPSIHHSTS